MDILLLTTLFSVLFAVFFLVLFVRMRQGQSVSSVEQDSLLPFANEIESPETGGSANPNNILPRETEEKKK